MNEPMRAPSGRRACARASSSRGWKPLATSERPSGEITNTLKMFELFEHTADLGLRVRAASLEELLIEAARGLLAMLVANPEVVRPLQTKSISVAADEPGFLLFDWLNELLFAFESEKLLFVQFELKLEDRNLQAICR